MAPKLRPSRPVRWPWLAAVVLAVALGITLALWLAPRTVELPTPAQPDATAHPAPPVLGARQPAPLKVVALRR